MIGSRKISGVFPTRREARVLGPRQAPKRDLAFGVMTPPPLKRSR